MLKGNLNRLRVVNYFGFIGYVYRQLYLSYVKLQRGFLKTKGIAPLRTFIYLTYRCNCVCYFCSAQYPSKAEMSLSDVKHILKQLPKGSIVTFIGGEVSMVKDFSKIIEYAAARHRVRFDTNGVAFIKDAELLRKMVDYGLWVIQFSIDAPNSIHDKIRGPEGLYENIVKAIRELKKIRQEKGVLTPLIHVNSVILKETIPYLPDMVQLSADLGIESLEFGGLGNNIDIPSFVYTYGITKNKFYDNDDLILFRVKMNEAIEKADKLKVNLRIKPNVRTLLGLLNNATSQDVSAALKSKIDMSGYFCPAPWSTILISPEGDVQMCEEFSTAVLGNIKKTPLKELWNNKAAQDFRKTIISTKELPTSCLKCCLVERD